MQGHPDINPNLVTRAVAAQQMGISECTITRCVKRGAPVHRWGSTGRHYRIDVSAFIKWMERQNGQETKDAAARKVIDLTLEQMAARRTERLRQMRGRNA